MVIGDNSKNKEEQLLDELEYLKKNVGYLRRDRRRLEKELGLFNELLDNLERKIELVEFEIRQLNEKEKDSENGGIEYGNTKESKCESGKRKKYRRSARKTEGTDK